MPRPELALPLGFDGVDAVPPALKEDRMMLQLRSLLDEHCNDLQTKLAEHKRQLASVLEVALASDGCQASQDRKVKQVREEGCNPSESCNDSESVKSLLFEADIDDTGANGVIETQTLDTPKGQTSLQSSPSHPSYQKAVTSKILRGDSDSLTGWKKVVNGPLDVFMGLIVTLNLLTMIWAAQCGGLEADASLGMGHSNDCRQVETTLDFLEYPFFVLYLADLVFRIAVLRYEWLHDKVEGFMYMNVFDALIVVVNAVELCILPFLANPDLDLSSANLKMLKLLRILRVMRILRASKLFRQIRVLLLTCIASMGAFAWSILLLLMFQTAFSLVITELLRGYIVDGAMEITGRKWVNERYGDFFKSLYTMFEITYSGGWPSLVRPVLVHAGPWYAIPFLLYITFVVFAVLRIITAIFIKETLACASDDAALALEEKKHVAEALHKKLEAVFEAMDVDGSGTLSVHEVQEALSKPVVADYMHTLELHVKDAHRMFEMLDDGDGQLSFHEFLSGLKHLKGQARAYDVMMILVQQSTLRRDIKKINKKVGL